MTTTENTAIEIVVPEKDQLPPSLLSNIETGFKSAFEQAEKWRTQALAIQVTSLDQKAEMKLARTIRLELKAVRVNADKARKSLKADALLMGRAIDGVYNLLEAAIVPMERHLDEQEKFAERLAESERLRLKDEREHALSPYLDLSMPLPALDAMSDEQFTRYLEDSKILHNAKLEAARKTEADRIAREQSEAAERERQRIELERLRKEAVEREAAAKAEREAAEKAQREAAAKAKAERDALEAAAKAEREAAEKELARIKAEAEAAAKKEQEARAKLEAELTAKKAAEEKAAAELAASQKKAARAPDKQKALTFAATVRTLKTPEATTTEGKAVMAEIAQKVENFAKWIETQAASL
jgi:hypothetical protein